MDAWSPEQLKKMQLGGNDALNAFFKSYGVDKYTEIRDKYNTQAAEVHPIVTSTLESNPEACIVVVMCTPDAEPHSAWLNNPLGNLQYYRDKIRAEIEGRTYVPPAPSASNNSLSRAGSAGSTRSARAAGNSTNDSWDDWGKPSTVKV